MNKLSVSKRICILFVFCAATAIATPAQTFTTLYSFCPQGGSHCTDGKYPISGLVQGTDGSLYGTTYFGGTNGVGVGTVFSITPGGTLRTLYNFCSQIHNGVCADGAEPAVGLVQGTNGDFYGATFYGGGNNNCGNGCGTVFSITAGGTLTTLHSFDGADGYELDAGLVQGANGKFYGTTRIGGANGHGTVFRITPSGALTTLHSFAGFPTGDEPDAGLVQGIDGNFYGTTRFGGANKDDGCGIYYGCGNIFKITPSGALTTLHSFRFMQGAFPSATLVQGTDGDFYGTTIGGGRQSGGTVFKIAPDGKLTTLYSFCSQSNCADGESPDAGLVQATDGNFYGTTPKGGANGDGTVFSITAGGTLTTLHSFDGTDGSHPNAGLVQDTDGKFYGTTRNGGARCDCGTVFSLSVGLGPLVDTNPTTGAVGENVTILGTNLTGATIVTFNGTPATFTVKLRSEITTTVPTGATTGTVQVLGTSSGTLSSNVPFRVLP